MFGMLKLNQKDLNELESIKSYQQKTHTNMSISFML